MLTLLSHEFYIGQSQAQSYWYQSGYWPLVGAILVLVITNAVSLYEIILSSRRSYRNDIKLKRGELLSDKLNSFYNPLYSLLFANESLFRAFGPRSFPNDDIRRKAAAQVWSEIRENVILSNNDRILAILEEKSHLLHDRDAVGNYADLINHLHSYKVFCKMTTEIHNRFPFPGNIIDHVRIQRDQLLTDLELTNKL